MFLLVASDRSFVRYFTLRSQAVHSLIKDKSLNRILRDFRFGNNKKLTHQ